MNLCTFWTFSTKRRKAGPIGPIRSTSPQRAMAGWRPPTRKQDDLHCDDTASQQLCWSVPQFVWERKRLIQVFAIHTALPFTHCNAFYVILCVPLAAKARREIQTLLHRTLRGSGPRMETSTSGLFSPDLICQIRSFGCSVNYWTLCRFQLRFDQRWSKELFPKTCQSRTQNVDLLQPT